MLHEEEAHIKGRQLPHHTSCCFLLHYYQVFTFFGFVYISTCC